MRVSCSAVKKEGGYITTCCFAVTHRSGTKVPAFMLVSVLSSEALKHVGPALGTSSGGSRRFRWWKCRVRSLDGTQLPKEVPT